jgi:hypothetical protein
VQLDGTAFRSSENLSTIDGHELAGLGLITIIWMCNMYYGLDLVSTTLISGLIG